MSDLNLRTFSTPELRILASRLTDEHREGASETLSKIIDELEHRMSIPEFMQFLFILKAVS